MPDKTFLETYPLYKKFKLTKKIELLDYHGPQNISLKMLCMNCKTEQTFLRVNVIQHGDENPLNGIHHLKYICAHCRKFKRYFDVFITEDDYRKVGQYPPWDISPDPHIEKMLGEHSEYFKKD